VGSAVDDIDFDDLTAPRLTDVQRQILEFTEAKSVDLDIDRMLAEAIEQTGLPAGTADLDDTDGFADRLRAHVGAIEADDALRQLTRGSLRQRIVRLLRNRLSLTELIRRYPEIESIPIEKPLIVVGMPRSGTTHLVNLIAVDPRRRALPYWESQDPIPAPGQGPDIFGVDPRYARAKAEHDALMASDPWWPRCMTGFPRRSRRKWSFSTSTWPRMCWNGMRACPIGATITWASTKRGTTRT
jgi:hypothetical protein